ncbi:hypothetical protein [Pedobacter caeni]|uniref:Uncharacterized protein n=1 Tax=Pedobacter caeni TaxID=288992 RepID=A0A1M5A504_9SPHI|nr:hypothetical protein [Pedobacter caeni]SHF25373.1 hypothetical protein SAMN04488522_102591 [Pedobacter caeni]
MYNKHGYYGLMERYQVERAIKMARILNIIGVIIAIAIFFSGEFEKYVTGAALIAPFIFMLIFRSYKGAISSDFSTDPYPTMIWGILAILISMFMRYVLDLNTLVYSGVWLPSIIIGVLFCLPKLIPGKGYKFRDRADHSEKIIMILLALSYGLVSTFTMNQVYDASVPRTYHVKVLDKISRSGRKTLPSCHLMVSPWSSRITNEEVEVGWKLYKNVKVNDEVNIYLLEGYLGIPWFVVQK